jgi:hypothetical protein
MMISPPQTFYNQEAARCDDCERELVGSSDGMDVDIVMDIGDEYACQSCGKRVCDVCAVSMHGRLCLTCASMERS